MNPLIDCKDECHLAVKAYHNLRGAVEAIEAFRETNDSSPQIALISFFHQAVLRYGKPFSPTRIGSSRRRYDCSKISNTPGFNAEVHADLINIRNQLVAHDDVVVVEPRILSLQITHRESGKRFATAIAISNSAIGYTKSDADAGLIASHMKVARDAVLKDLDSRICEYRKILLDHPEWGDEILKYRRTIGESIPIPKEGGRLPHLRLGEESYMETATPEFRAIAHGFEYELLTIQRDFHGPESIPLSDGGSLVLGMTKEDSEQGE